MVDIWTVHVFSPGCTKVIHPDQSSEEDEKDKDVKEAMKNEDVIEDEKDEDVKEDVANNENKDEDFREDKDDIKEDKKDEDLMEDKKEEGIKVHVNDKDKDDEDLEPRVVNPKTDEQRFRLLEACRDVLLFTSLDQVSKFQILHCSLGCSYNTENISPAWLLSELRSLRPTVMDLTVLHWTQQLQMTETSCGASGAQLLF